MNWKKTVKRTAVIGAAILVFAMAGAVAIVHTVAFHRFVLVKIIQKADESTGGRLEIQTMAIHWTELRVDFYNLVLHGTEGEFNPPVLRAERLEVGLKIVSLFHRKIDLNEIVLNRPTVHVAIDSHGHSNLPRPPHNGSSSMNVFDLAIRHVAVNSGRLYYNDEEIPLSAQFHDFQTQIRFDTLANEYRGHLAYDRGILVAKRLSPVEHGADLQFTASRSRFIAAPLIVTSGESRITLHAKVTDYANLDIRGSYDGYVHTAELAHVMKNPSLPLGQFSFTGTVQYHRVPGQTFIDSAFFDGHLTSPEVGLRVRGTFVDARAVQADYLLQRGDLRVSHLYADLLGGRVSASFYVRHISRSPASQLDAWIRGVSLKAASGRALTSMASIRFKKRPQITGSVNGELHASWTSSFQNVMARAHVVISQPARIASAPGEIPLSGVLDLNYNGVRDIASFDRSYLRTGATQISLSGMLSKNADLSVQANTTDLQQISQLISVFRDTNGSAKTSVPSRAYDLHGAARFSGQVRGSLKDLRIHGQLTATNIQVDGSKWPSLRTNIKLSSANVTLNNGDLLGQQRGRVTFDAQAGLQHWSFTPLSPVSLRATATNISAADLERLAEVHSPVSGTLSATIDAEGSEQNPSGHGSVQLSHGSAWNEPITNLAIKFKAQGASIRSTGQLRIPAGTVSGILTYTPRTQSYEASVSATGLKLDQIHNLQDRNLGVRGALTASAKGCGTLHDPQFTANVQIPQLQVSGQTISQVQARFAVAHQHADFALTSTVIHGYVQAKGGVDLTGQRLATVTADVRALPIGALLASYLPGHRANLQGETEIHARLNGPLADPRRIEAHIEVPTLNLAYDSARLALVRPLRMDYRDGAVTIEQAEMQGTGTHLTAQGVIPIKSAVPLNLSAKATLDLGAVQGLVSGLKSSGRVDLNISAKGDLSHPAMQGKVQIQNATVLADTIPVGLENVNGEIQIAGNRIEISKLNGAAGGGSLSASGFMIYGKQSNFNLALQTRSVRIRYPQGLRSVLDSNLTLNGTPADSTLTGRVLIDRLSFTQEFDLATFMGQFTGESAPATPSRFEQNMKLNVSVQSSQGLDLASSKLSVEGAANVNVTGTLATPVILGRVTLSGGEIFFLGKRYEVQSGTIEFANPIHTEPVLNLYVNTVVEQYKITLNLVGPVDRLRTNYTSDPPLAPSDIINLIAFGKTATEAQANAGGPASLGAESVIANGVGSQASSRLEKLTGISQITIDPLASNSGQNPGSQIAIQERVTGSLLLTFSTDVTSTQSESVELQYQFDRRTSISVLRDQNGGYGIDVRIHKVF